MREPRRRLRIAGALASGLLFALAFPGPDLAWLAWVALVPLLLAIRDLSPAQSFRYGLLAGLLGFGLLLEWIRIFGLPAWTLLTAVLALYLGGFAAGTSLLVRGRPVALLWAAPLAWVAVEVARSVGPLGFPWGLLGLTQYRTPAVLGLASVAGVYGISGLIALVNATVAVALSERRIDRVSGAAMAAASLVVAAALASGAVSAGAVREGARRAEHRIVAVVQPNVSPLRRGIPSDVAQITAGLLRQTGEARSAGAEIIVYPETAVPADLGEAPELRAAIAHGAAGALVVAGASLGGPRNGAVVLDHEGEPLGTYAKQRLVPFGEAGVVPGVDAQPVRTTKGTIGLVICYESAFPFMVRSLASGGAGVITVLTNDGWFGPSAGPAQHAAHAVVRAMETGRSVARAANTGSSMLIGPDGTVLRSLPLDTAGVLVASLPVGGLATPYVSWGWLIAPLAAAVWVLAAAPAGIAALRRRPAAAWRLAAALAIPAVPWVLGRLLTPGGDGPGPLVALGVLLASMLVGRGHLLNRRGVWVSAAVSLGATGLLVWAIRAAYAQYGFQMPAGVPAGGWFVAVLGYALGGIAVEAWLRGAVFAAAQALGGWVLAVAVSTSMGVGLYLGLGRVPQEILFWHLITSAGFGLLRARTGDAVGLGPARGLGDAAILALSGLR
ncbi:MAG: apolipoprotein N-acyltransferase [Armatimonadetes bacterium]|nr:apolipoprotein N-acyltransferase [Armatimonadota bacterium]